MDAPPRSGTPPQLFYDHPSVEVCSLNEGPLTGLRHRTVIDKDSGACALALWQEEHESGFVVPPHLHDCEEIISVSEGMIEATIEEKKFEVGPQQSVLIPAWAPHGFRVISPGPVRLLALFSSSDPKIFRLDRTESIPPWRGGSSDHLENQSR